jgi:hypothetical protein
MSNILTRQQWEDFDDSGDFDVTVDKDVILHRIVKTGVDYMYEVFEKSSGILLGRNNIVGNVANYTKFAQDGAVTTLTSLVYCYWSDGDGCTTYVNTFDTDSQAWSVSSYDTDFIANPELEAACKPH